MSAPLPADSRAFRRELLGLMLGFIVSFAAAIAMLIWWSVRRFPEDGWWTIEIVLGWLPAALIVGMLGALAVHAPLSWLHHRMGVYRCWQCGRPIRRGSGRRARASGRK